MRAAPIADATADTRPVSPRPRTRWGMMAGWAVVASLAGVLAAAGDALTYRAANAEIVWIPSLQTGTLGLKGLSPSVPGESL